MTDQLSAKDWLDQGLKTLAENGFTALKAEPLAKAMGVSRGSFYWHFADIGAFHAAILKHWREVAAEQIIANLEAAADSDNPLPLLLRRAFGGRLVLENAVRTWATLDPVARSAVQAIDRRRLSYVESLLRASGLAGRGRRGPARRFSTGRFSALRCRTSHCRGRDSRRCSTNCSGSPRDKAARLHVSIEYATGAKYQAGDQSMTASPERLEGTVDPKLLEILVCPLTKGPLEFDAAKQELISRSAKARLSDPRRHPDHAAGRGEEDRVRCSSASFQRAGTDFAELLDIRNRG